VDLVGFMSFVDIRAHVALHASKIVELTAERFPSHAAVLSFFADDRDCRCGHGFDDSAHALDEQLHGGESRRPGGRQARRRLRAAERSEAVLELRCKEAERAKRDRASVDAAASQIHSCY
jgi:hypothetical protein